MSFSIIAAVSRNNVIGKDNKLPWDIPEDSEYFYNFVCDKTVFMGQKTYESIGHPIDALENIVLSFDHSLKIPGCLVLHSIEEVLERYRGEDREIMIIGGESIYREFLPYVDKMYLTFIDADFEGDTHFPNWNKDDWVEISRRDSKNDLCSYSFVILKRG